MKENAQHVYNQNYHGTLYQNISAKAQNLRSGQNKKFDEENEKELSSGFRKSYYEEEDETEYGQQQEEYKTSEYEMTKNNNNSGFPQST